MTQDERKQIQNAIKNAIASYDLYTLQEIAKQNDYAIKVICSHLLLQNEQIERIKNILN